MCAENVTIYCLTWLNSAPVLPLSCHRESMVTGGKFMDKFGHENHPLASNSTPSSIPACALSAPAHARSAMPWRVVVRHDRRRVADLRTTDRGTDRDGSPGSDRGMAVADRMSQDGDGTGAEQSHPCRRGYDRIQEHPCKGTPDRDRSENRCEKVSEVGRGRKVPPRACKRPANGNGFRKGFPHAVRFGPVGPAAAPGTELDRIGRIGE